MSHLPLKCKRKRHVLFSSACGFLLMFSNAQADLSQSKIEKITVNWTCKWCPYEKKVFTKGSVEAGIGSVSNSSYKHGDYTGLDEKGAYFVGNGSYEFKDQDSNYVDVIVRDVGLESRQVEADVGKQGKYDVELNYASIPRLTIDTARTPYRGEGSQTLPVGWIQGATTANMTELENSLRDVDIYTERKTINVGATYYASPTLSYDLNFQQQAKQGKKTMGLAILTSSVILAVPVDTLTKQGGVKVNYRAQRWQGSLGYAFSIFDNTHDRVLWDNAYSTPATASVGQAALEPNNEMQQITLDGAYRFSVGTQATAAIQVGRMTQNADYLPYTVNGSLSPPTLPRTSLDGKVNTVNTTLRLNSRWNEDWNYSVQYQYNDQANDTPRATYDYVFTDFVVSANPRANFPYSFRETELSLQGRYQIDKQRNISLDYEHEIVDRTYQEVESSDEDTLSAAYRSKVNEQFQWSLGLKASNRKGDDYTPVLEISPPENDLLRKYNLANRMRKSATVSLSFSLSDALQLSAFAEHASDDYSDSDIGLQESDQSSYSLELQYRISTTLNTNFDYSVTNIGSEQFGETWNAENEDSIHVAHVGVNYELRKYKLLLGADLSYANAEGEVTVSTGNGFPTLKSTRKTLSLFADYSLDDRSTIRAVFRYENYEEEDWAIDGVVPNTLNNVLTLGEVSPSYDIGVFAVSYKTQF
ncbi:MAG: MtrB/PioB family decaheme-associated outer membrane protein [Gammaproteobacteria bacterium]|nr:MtrB/PioB family decaheme-associated outer membrane protein [Gammaproteobacteria bacterium]